MSEIRETVEVAVGIVLDDGRVLLTRRPGGGHLQGLWEFPGGKMEPAETPEDCAAREVAEETGLLVTPSGVLAEHEHTYPERVVRLHFIKCRPCGSVLDPALQEAKWIPVGDLPLYEMPAGNAAIIALLLSRAGK